MTQKHVQNVTPIPIFSGQSAWLRVVGTLSTLVLITIILVSLIPGSPDQLTVWGKLILQIVLSIPIFICTAIFYKKRVIEAWRPFVVAAWVFIISVTTGVILVIFDYIKWNEWTSFFLYNLLLPATITAFVFPVILEIICIWVNPYPPRPNLKFEDLPSVNKLQRIWTDWFEEVDGKLKLYQSWSYMELITRTFINSIKEQYQYLSVDPPLPPPENTVIERLRRLFRFHRNISAQAKKLGLSVSAPYAERSVKAMQRLRVSSINAEGWELAFRGLRERLRGKYVIETDFNQILTHLKGLADYVESQQAEVGYRKEYLTFARQIRDMATDFEIFRNWPELD